MSSEPATLPGTAPGDQSAATYHEPLFAVAHFAFAITAHPKPVSDRLIRNQNYINLIQPLVAYFLRCSSIVDIKTDAIMSQPHRDAPKS